MPDKKDKIKNLAASGLSQFEASPPDDMWARIEHQIDRRKRLVFFRAIALAASVLILLGVGISLLMPGSERDVNQNKMTAADGKNVVEKVAPVQSTEITGTSERTNRSEPDAEVVLSESSESSPEAMPDVSAARTIKPALIKPDSEFTPPEIAFVSETLMADKEPVADTLVRTELVAEAVPAVPEVELISLQPGNNNNVGQPITEDNQKKSAWGLAMGYGSTPAIELRQEESALKSPGNNFSFDEISADLANETSFFDEVENITHHAPVTLGMLVSRQFAKRWNVESGLLYTKLGYLIRTIEMNASYREYRNDLYYLGIPIGVRFNILAHKRFGIYATQSVILEKGIAGRGYTDSYSKGLLKGSESNKISIRGIQLSSLTGLGGEVKIAGKLSVYGQTGVQLFYLNGSQPYNIRSARMAWPSFQAGLRIQLN